jgi:ABC-type branched-subunit amino acid transport system substrate-binding protein
VTLERSPERSQRTRRIALAGAAVSIALVLAGCGSRLDPNDVAVAGGSVGADGTVIGADGTVVGGDGSVVGSDGSSGSTGGSTGSTGSGGSTGSTGSGGSSGSGGEGGSAAPGDPIPTGNCDGFKNSTGITDDTIVIGNSSDVSGPVPGLFESAQDAVKAFVAYYNASNPDGICGRSLSLKAYDSQTDAAADQRNHVDACDNVFAMVGSMSAFDSGGAAATEQCGMPDIRSAGVTAARQGCSTCFGAQSTIANQFENAVADYVKAEFPEASQNAAMLYINAGAAQENGTLQPKAMTERGMKFVYEQGFDTAEFNYAPYVQELKDRGARHVQILGGVPQFVRMMQTFQQQGYEPDIAMFDPTAYDADFIESGGDAVEGATAFINFVPFEEAASSPETALYLNWLQQSKPGATPDFFGLFAWSAARLFTEQAAKLGGKLSRPALIDALEKVDNWTANGLHSPQHVGPRRTGDCWRFIQVQNGKWVPVGGTKYRCNGVTVVN